MVTMGTPNVHGQGIGPRTHYNTENGDYDGQMVNTDLVAQAPSGLTPREPCLLSWPLGGLTSMSGTNSLPWPRLPTTSTRDKPST